MTSYARATYPGISYIQSVSATTGHGVTPGIFQLTIAPQDQGQLIEIGTLRLEYADQVLDFPDCRVDQASFLFDTDGNLIRLMIFDRRWRWALAEHRGGDEIGLVSGQYNVRRADGTIRRRESGVVDPNMALDDSERTPEQLVRILLAAAGESISAGTLADLPTDTRPYVNWDYDPPMHALQSLCELMGFRIVLGLDNNVRLHRVNVGAPLSVDGVKRYGAEVPMNDTPDRVAVVTGPIRYQHDFSLRAIGQDLDGNWKPIDDLSYKPASGWNTADVLTDFTIIEDDAPRTLAMRTVFRCYEIVFPLQLPTWDGQRTVRRREEIELLSTQTWQENDDGVRVDRAAMVYGVYYRDNDAAPGNSLPFAADGSVATPRYLPDDVVEQRKADDPRVAQIVDVGFSIDVERRMVIFSNYVFLTNESDSEDPYPADLLLRTSCHYRRPEDGRIDRLVRERILRNADRPTVAVDVRGDITPWARGEYDGFSANFLTGTTNNEADIAAEIEDALSAAVIKYGSPNIAQDAVYAGWRFDIQLDGAIQRISWDTDASGSGPITTVQRNHDTGGAGGLPYKLSTEYLRLARVRRAAARKEWTEKRRDEFNDQSRIIFSP